MTKAQMAAVLCNAEYCSLAVVENDQPYVIPMYFDCVYDGCKPTFYLYSYENGMKTACIKENSKVCLNIMTQDGNKFNSIVVIGKAKLTSTCCEKGKTICIAAKKCLDTHLKCQIQHFADNTNQSKKNQRSAGFTGRPFLSEILLNE